MKQPLTDKSPPSHIQLETYLRANISWSKTRAAVDMWRSEVGRDTWTVRVNDFPEEHLYTLLVNGDEIGSFDEWPKPWLRGEELQPDSSTQVPSPTARTY